MGIWKRTINPMDMEDNYEDEAYEEPAKTDFRKQDKYEAAAQYSEEEDYGTRRPNKVIEMPETRRAPGGAKQEMLLFKPSKYTDSHRVIELLKSRRGVIINLADLDKESAQRILDCIGGGVFALGADIKRVDRSIFIVVPSTMNLQGYDKMSDKEAIVTDDQQEEFKLNER